MAARLSRQTPLRARRSGQRKTALRTPQKPAWQKQPPFGRYRQPSRPPPAFYPPVLAIDAATQFAGRWLCPSLRAFAAEWTAEKKPPRRRPNSQAKAVERAPANFHDRVPCL